MIYNKVQLLYNPSFLKKVVEHPKYQTLKILTKALVLYEESEHSKTEVQDNLEDDC